MVFKDNIIVQDGSKVIDSLDHVVVAVMALRLIFIITIALALDSMVRVTIVGQAVNLLVLGVRQLHDVCLLHYKSFDLMSHRL